MAKEKESEEKPSEEKEPVEEEIPEEKAPEEEKAPKEKRADDNVIFVGNKPPMNYVTAIITQFNAAGSKEVTLKARGSAITRAVDAAEIVRNRFMTDLVLKDIVIGTESVTNEEGRTSNVSSIEITLAKK